MTMFSFRPVERSDRPALQQIARQTWEGSDYLPYVMDDWLTDDGGEFTAVIAEDRLVGCGKLSFPTPTDAWLEGLRKDPASRHKGVATAVTSYFLSRLASRRDLTSIRFATYFDNRASIASAEKLGFHRTAVFSWKSLEGRSGEAPEDGSLGGRPDDDEVRRFIESSTWLAASGSLLVEGWMAIPYSWDLFVRRYLRKGQCRFLMDHGKLKGLSVSVVDTRYPYTYLKGVFLEAADAVAEETLLRGMVGRVREGPAERFQAEMVIPPGARAAGSLEKAGFRSMEREGDFLVFEHPLGRQQRPGGPAEARRARIHG